MPVMDRYTYLFEIIFPENRIVLDYGDRDDLVAIGAVPKFGGRAFGPSMAMWDGWQGPMVQILSHGDTLRDALARTPRPNAEGLVVRFLATSERVKIKQEDYVALHRIIFGLNERAVWQRLLDGDHSAVINRDLPEEFHPWVNKVAKRLIDEGFDIADAACDDFAAILKVIGPQPQGHTGFEFEQDVERTRKKWFASLAVKSKNRGLLFLLYDDKSLHEAIFKMIRPEAIFYTKEAA